MGLKMRALLNTTVSNITYLVLQKSRRLLSTFVLATFGIASFNALAATVELNSSGGVTTTDGLHVYIDSSTQIQVRRVDNSGQLYHPNATPPDNRLDNGIYLRANGAVYGPDHFAINTNSYATTLITGPSPANPIADGVQQTATSTFGVLAGPQVTVNWKYNRPYEFVTAEVTLVIPTGYPVSATNPVRYYHAADTFLGGSDRGCGTKYTDENGKLVVGTYPSSTGVCSTSTGLPANVSVVESFRERSSTFSNYCVGYYNDFWNGSGCAVNSANDLSNLISTTYLDTGLAIEYKFTSAGTYKFSYDYVLGSTQTPAYDHVEIQHAGSGTLCPLNVQVMACTVSTVPCPAANRVNTASLTGSIKSTPSSPNVTQTPSAFNVGAAGSIASVALQANGAGTVTLSATGLSSLPLNGTKCWNTTTNTASCDVVFSNIACASNFECIEKTASFKNINTLNPTVRNPLYTQVVNQPFAFDVVAVDATGGQLSSYANASGVTVELVDDTISMDCKLYPSGVTATQMLTFSASDNGRKTTSNFTVNNAYKKLRCRVVDSSNPTSPVRGCSSDDFAVRPSAFTSLSLNGGATADASGLSTTNGSASVSPKTKLKAGTDAFAITAGTGLTGYTGTPKVDNNKLIEHSGNMADGSVTGVFGPASSGTASGSGFKYTEVGYFKVDVNGVYDDKFTDIDPPGLDCAEGFTASGGKNACSFGNSAPTTYLGRFIPDHFNTVTTQTCASGNFTYANQPFTTTVTAYDGSSPSNVTKNYHGLSSPIFAKNITLTDGNGIAGSFVSGTNTIAASAFNQGVVTTSTPRFTFTNPQTVPSVIKIRAVETSGQDDVTSNVGGVPVEGLINLRSGRLNFTNSHGSELQPLSFVMEAQYWSVNNAYQRNIDDSCSAIDKQNIVMSNYSKNLSACETVLSGGGQLISGQRTFTLSKPGAGNNGSVNLSVNLDGVTGGGVQTCTSGTQTAVTGVNLPQFGTTDVTRRATFGVYKSPIIYMRESF